MNARTHPGFWPVGTVYGTLMNFRGELLALGDQLAQPPYKAPPQATVLYVKTANTWSANGAGITLPRQVPRVEVGASVALVVGAPSFAAPVGAAQATVAGYVLVNDLSLPHGSFFRPPVRFKCPDGFLVLGPHGLPIDQAGDPARWVLEVRINGAVRQTVRFSELVRDAATLLADVSAFMALREGDLLLLGCDAGRPLAEAGDDIDIRVPGQPALGVLTHRLLAAGTVVAA